MPDLEMLLRDLRPVPDPAWTARLDARVARRFPGPIPRWKQALITARDHMLAIGAVATVASLMIVVVMAGVSYDGGEDAEPASGGSAAAPQTASEESSSDSSGGSSELPLTAMKRNATGAAPDALVPAQAHQQEDRSVKKSATLTLTTTHDQVEAVNDRAIRVVDRLGGFVQSSEVDSNGSRSSAALDVRIPTGRLDDALAQLSKLAHVKARTQQSEDLTDAKAALEASVRDARADRDGLRARLAKAATDKERSQLRAKLDLATRRVTRRERDVANLGREVAYATVGVEIQGVKRSGAAAAAPGDRWTPGDAVGDAGRVLEVIAGVLVIGLAILFPIAVLALLAGLAGRVVTRRRRLRALEMA